MLLGRDTGDRWLRSAAYRKIERARATAKAIDGARLVILPGVGHDLPAPLWPVIADEVRQNADRAHGPAN